MTKFGIVGLAGLVVDVGSFNVLCYAGGRGPLYDLPLIAKVISTALGIIVGWLGHRFWTFSEKRRAAVHRELAVFVGVYLIGLGISLGPLAVSHDLLGLRGALADNISANVIGLGLATAFRYWAMHKHVFTGARRRTETGAIAPRGDGAHVIGSQTPGPRVVEPRVTRR